MRGIAIVICAACGGSSSPSIDATPDVTPGAAWESAPPLPLGPTQETAVVATGGKIYVLGGFNGSGAVVAAVQVYDPIAKTWSMGPALPKAVHHANAVAHDGTIYVLGAMETINFTAIPDVWAWNPATETTWTPKTPMPAGTQRGSAVAGAIDGKIYVAGGLRAGAVTEVSIFDPVANAWAAGPALPLSRDHGCGGVVGGKLYLLGGRQANITSQSPIVYELTPGVGWAERMPMPTARGGTACGVVGDRIVVVGGEGNSAVPSGVFPEAEVYNATTNTWATLEPMPTPRHGMGAAVVGGRMYIPGGANKQGFGAVATHEVLTP
jgi:N-acetylneuraminic acid mutarotase